MNDELKQELWEEFKEALKLSKEIDGKIGPFLDGKPLTTVYFALMLHIYMAGKMAELSDQGQIEKFSNFIQLIADINNKISEKLKKQDQSAQDIAPQNAKTKYNKNSNDSSISPL
jgi:ABC-type glycerol-3-phosphate transport system substrate-binding protein